MGRTSTPNASPTVAVSPTTDAVIKYSAYRKTSAISPGRTKKRVMRIDVEASLPEELGELSFLPFGQFTSRYVRRYS